MANEKENQPDKKKTGRQYDISTTEWDSPIPIYTFTLKNKCVLSDISVRVSL